MNVLILINSAGGHRPFFSRVGDELAQRGHRITFAIDSHYTDVLYARDSLHHPAHYFSDYFRQHRGRAVIPAGLMQDNLRLAMFPDFDRLAHPAARGAGWRNDAHYYEDLLACLTSYFWQLFSENDFQRVVYEGVSNSFAYIAYLAAKRHGAEYVGFAPSRLPKRLDVSTSQYHRDSRLARTYQELREGKRTVAADVQAAVRSYLDTFAQSTPDYMVVHAKTSANPFARYLKRGSLARVVSGLRYQLGQPEDHDHAYQLPDFLRVYPNQFSFEIARSFRKRKLQKEYYQIPDLQARFWVYPIHVHPESSTSVDGPYAIDELAAIRNLSLSLPVTDLLYVKDHRHVGAARQPLSFYEELRRMPNVVLIDPAFDSKRLVTESVGVITNTSTMGFEALVLGKPVVVLGSPFYDFHPRCIRLESFTNAFEIFRQAALLEPAAGDVVDLVTAYYLCTYPGTYSLAQDSTNAQLIQTAASIVETPPVAS